MKKKLEVTNHPCPNCGYCPHCGRGGLGVLPYYPYPWMPTGPTWIGNPTWTTTTAGTAVTYNGA